MALAVLRHEVPDRLACDFQQYYGCWDFSRFPPAVAAALTAGLPEESRSIRHLAGDVPDTQLLLLAAILDQLRALFYFFAGDADERPESVVAHLMGKERQSDADTLSFETPEAFEAARANIIQNQQKEVAEDG